MGMEYDWAIDWWSLGALLYEMLTGLPPWYNRDRKKMFAGIRAGELRFPDSVPADAQSLLRALLCRNPHDRLGATQDGVQQIRRHAFFASIDWDALVRREMPPPWKPQAESSQDVEKMSLIYFDKVFTRLPVNSDGSSRTDSPSMSPPGAQSAGMAIGGGGGGGVGGDQFTGFSYVPTSGFEVSVGLCICLHWRVCNWCCLTQLTRDLFSPPRPRFRLNRPCVSDPPRLPRLP